MVVWRRMVDDVIVVTLTAEMIVPLVGRPEVREGILPRTTFAKPDHGVEPTFPYRHLGAIERYVSGDVTSTGSLYDWGFGRQ
jgi:hypothetical protein